MSVKDLIWVRVGQNMLLKQKLELKKQEVEANVKCFEAINMTMADLRALALDTNLFVRMNALKDTKARKLKAFNIDDLPSVSAQKEEEEKKLLEKMTPEELELYKFNKGERVRY